MAKKRRRRTTPFFTVLIIIAILAGGAFFYWQYANSDVILADAVTVNIPDGASTGQIADILREAGLIKSGVAFRLYTKEEGVDSKLKPGEYTFEAGNIDFAAISKLLVQGKQAAGIKVTIPEGLTVLEIGNILAEKGLVDLDAFIEYTVNGDFSYDYLPAKGTAERLEGFLFPSTYQMMPDWGMEKITEILLAQFDKVFTDEWRAQTEKQGMSISEIVTLASIIEKEARVASDRPIIAGVFYNRLKKPMRLESCATIQYILGETKPVLTYADLQIDSPYNTYRHDGLPPGPIACPGASSLEAALYPEDNDYYFFLAKPDGSHYFSKTLAEHDAAKKKYLK